MRKMSMALGQNESYFQQYSTYGRPALLDGEILRKAAHYLGVSEKELLVSAFYESAPDGGFDMSMASAYQPISYKKGGNDIVFISVYDIPLSDNKKPWNAEENVTGQLTFTHNFLRSMTRAPLEKLVVVRVRADNMHPTLSNGDDMLIDLSQVVAQTDGIYAMAQGGNLLLRRVSIDPVRRTLRLFNDNSSYPENKEYSLVDLPVSGRVIWLGKRI